jgi:hypothetical protein
MGGGEQVIYYIFEIIDGWAILEHIKFRPARDVRI